MSFDFILETERWIVRPLQEQDYDAWLQGFTQRSASQHAFDDGLLDMSECTEDWFRNLVKHHQNLWQTDKMYIVAVFDKEHNHIGMLNLATLVRDNMQWGELGYTIHNQYWRNGYAFESLSGLLQVANSHFKFHRIEANIHPDNQASLGLINKLGFEFECRRKNYYWENNQWSDRLIYYKNFS